MKTFRRFAVEIYFLLFVAAIAGALLDTFRMMQDRDYTSWLAVGLIAVAVMFGVAAMVAADVREKESWITS